MQDKRPQMGNQNVQLIGVEDHTLEQKINVVTQSGLATDGAQSNGVKNTTAEWARKSIVKSPTFELQKENKPFCRLKETSAMQEPLV